MPSLSPTPTRDHLLGPVRGRHPPPNLLKPSLTPPALRQMGPFRSPAPSPRAAGPLPQKTRAHLANTTSATPRSAGPHPDGSGGRPCGGWKQTSLTVHAMPWDLTVPPAGQESLCR